VTESIIQSLKTPQDLITFFEREFPDAIPLIGQEKLIKDFFHNPKSSLMSIKVPPRKGFFLTAVHTISLQRQSSHHRRRSTQPSPLLRPRSKHRLRRLDLPLLALPPSRPRSRPLQNLYRVLPRADSGCPRGLRPCTA
jgi:hypothetical protein